MDRERERDVMDAYDENSNGPYGRHGPGGTAGPTGSGAPSPGGTPPAPGSGGSRPQAAPTVPTPSPSPEASQPPSDATHGPSAPDAEAETRTQTGSEARTGVAALSPRYQVGAALSLAIVAVVACVHLGMVFLHVAPSNTVSKAHGKAIEQWIYP